MAKMPNIFSDSLANPAGPYDGAAAEPWFLPQDHGDANHPPLPGMDRRSLIAAPTWAADWAAAQAALAAELAELALLYGALEERLCAGPDGWRHRLALLEAADLSWAVGDRVPAERLALWEALRLSGVQEDAQGLARASWAVRRLLGADAVGFASFFGRQGVQGDTADMAALQAQVAYLHPVTRAVALAQSWLMRGQGGSAGQLEAAVLAGRLAAEMGRRPGFVPQALSGGRIAQGSSAQGSAAQGRLADWLRLATQATQAAFLHLDRLAAWQARAAAALADLRGRTPQHLVTVAVEWPMVTAGLAAARTGADKATVLRNLALMERRGLLREVTGQDRYRVWTAQL